MTSSRKYILNVLTTGIFTLLIVSIILFWVRWIPQTIFQGSIEKHLNLTISPAGLVPDEIENDPNVVRHSEISAHAYDLMSVSSGMFTDIRSEIELGRCASNVYGPRAIPDENNNSTLLLTYFDKKLGLFVMCEPFQKKVDNRMVWNKKIRLYAGPNGISEKPEKTLGRFIEPTANIEKDYPQHIMFYDKGLRRFFAVEFWKETVRKGPQIQKDLQLIQVGQLQKNDFLLNLNWQSPMVASAKKRTRLKPVSNSLIAQDYWGYLAIDKTGEIYRLDFNSLELVGLAVRLPEPPGGSAALLETPDNLLAYKVLQLIIPDRHNPEHLGIYAATLSREGMGLALSALDENGRGIKQERTGITGSEQGCVAWMISKFLFENLQPPVFGVASYFTANVFEAASGHKALFVLPNSFVSMFRRDKGDAVVARFFAVLFIFMAPSWVLSVWLLIRVRKNAVLLGLSARAKLFWTIATLAFGLSAYFTYRLTRPKITLVTCANCGKLRRPDNQLCHRCRAKWLIPELTPPSWKVIG